MIHAHRPDNPFPGLRSFTPEEDHLFFGREEQTMDLLQKLGAHRFVAVVGTSGSGKSSLVRCGLLSQLLGGKMLAAGTSWEVAVTHPGAAPMNHLAASLLATDLYDATEEDAKARLLATLSRSHLGLIEAIRQAQLPAGTNFLLVVDQFEEIFRFNQGGAAQRDTANEFVSMLLQAATQKDVPIYIVLTMRSDFIGDCAQFENLAEAVNRGEYLIPRMTRDQFKQSIEGPIRVAGGTLTPRLLQRLLNDLGDQADQLPCLQHALMRTWDQWRRSSTEGRDSEGRVTRVPDSKTESGDSQSSSLRGVARSLDLEDYDAIGRMREALSRHADELYASLGSDRARQLCAAMFKALTLRESENRGIRRPQTLGRLAQIVDVPAAELAPIIETFRQAGVTFLMPPPEVPLADATVIDISHESLMRVWVRLRDWVEEEASSVGIFHRLAESAGLHGKGKAGLYRDPELGIALSWRDEAHANAAWADQYGGHFDQAMAYLERSRTESEREEKEREAARQRELAQAKAIAENQRLRAEEKSRSARRMRWLMRVAMAVAVLALIAMVFAGMAKREALRSAELARKNEEKAQAAETKVARELYVADMNRAGQAYAEGSINELDELLSRHKPTEGTAAGPDLRGPEWYFWQHASRRELASGGRPISNFHDVAVAPDQRTVATVNWPGNVSLYDVASRNLVKVIQVNGSTNRNVSIAYSPEGTTLAATGPHPYLRRWDTRTWLPLTPDLTFPDGYRGGASAGQAPLMVTIAYSPNGKHLLAAGTDNGLVALWDTRTWQVVKVLDVFEEARGAARVHELAFSHDGRRLAAGVGPQAGSSPKEESGALVIWDTTHFEKIFDRPSDSPVVTLAFSPPDDRLLVSGSRRGEVNLWDMTSPSTSPLEQLHKARARIKQVRFSPQGRYLAASTEEGNAILVWELQPSPRLISSLKGHSKGSRIDFVGDEFTLWSAGEDFGLKVWDIRASGVSTEIPNTTDSVGLGYLAGGRLAWRTPPSSQDPAALVTARNPSGVQRARLPTPIRLYDVAGARELPPWKEGEKFTLHATSANGRFLAAQGEDRRLRLWNVEDGVLLGTTPGPASEGDLVTGLLTVANNGSRVAWAEMRGIGFTVNSLHLWTPSASRHVRWPSTEIEHAYGLKLSEDGTLLAATGDAGTLFAVVVWDAVPDQPVLLQKIRRGNPAVSLAFSPDGSRLACGAWDSGIQLIEPRTGKDLGAPLLGHAQAVGSVAFFPDGNMLLSGSWDQTIRLWDVNTGVRRATLPALGDTFPKELILEPQGLWMVSVLAGQEARLWQFNDVLDPRRNEMFWSDEAQPAGNHGDFAKARRVARQAVETAPDQAGGEPWFALAALAVREGDLEDFRKVRRDMLAHFSDKPYLIPAALTAAVCTMLPATPEELAVGLKLAERPATEDPVGWVGSMAAASLAFGDYRLGHYEAAVRKAEEYLGVNTRWQLPALDIPAVLAQAMSQHQLQKPAEARDALTKAREMMAVLDEQFPGTPERPSNNGQWHRWMLIKALLAEAETLIEGKPAAPQPPRAGGSRP